MGCWNHKRLVQFLRGPMAVVQHDQEGPMPQAAKTRSEEPLPLGTAAILSNIALSLLMWNIALRLGWLLAAA